MAIERNEFINVVVDITTPSGHTYYVDGKSVCCRPLSQDRQHLFCANHAGSGTGHLGMGACQYHGGMAENAYRHSIQTGRYGGKVYRSLQRHYEEFIVEPDFLDLLPELALARGLLADQLEQYGHGSTQATKVMKSIIDIVTIVERIERIQSQQVLTVTTVRLMMARGLEIARQFIEPEELEQFILMWKDEPTIKLSSFLPASVRVEE